MSTYQFKIDENLPVEIADLLMQAGYDAKTVNEQHLQGAKDSVVINVCKSENRILVTLDTDFSNIRTYPPEEYAGIVVLRVARQDKPYLMEIFHRIIQLIDREPLSQHLWIVEDSRIRIRGKDAAEKV